MKGKIAISLAAAFGGISPNILKIAICLTGDERRDPGVNSGYLVGLLLLAALGAAVALIWGEGDLRKAFYLGIGLPAMLQIALSGASARDSRGASSQQGSQQGGFNLFASPAYAAPFQETQTPAKASQQTAGSAAPTVAIGSKPNYGMHRSLALVLDDVPRGTELVFSSPDGALTYKETVPKNDENGRAVFNIPDFAAKISLRTEELESASFKLDESSGSTTTYNVDIDSDFLGGFLRALGVEGAGPYKFEIDPVPH